MRSATTFGAVMLLALAGCEANPVPSAGGQSGGIVDGPSGDLVAEGMLAPACECIAGSRAVAVIGVLEQLDACGVAVRVMEVLDGEERAPVEVGDLLEGTPLGCTQEMVLQAGDEVLALYAPIKPAPVDPDASDLAASSGPAPQDLGAQLFLAPVGTILRIDGTDTDLPESIDGMLEILLDGDKCEEWVEEHEVPHEPGEGELEDDGEGEGEGLEGPITPEPEPEGPVMGPTDSEEPLDCEP